MVLRQLTVIRSTTNAIGLISGAHLNGVEQNPQSDGLSDLCGVISGASVRPLDLLLAAFMFC